MVLFDTHPAAAIPKKRRQEAFFSSSKASREKGLSVCVLGSGSGGNATIARLGGRHVLIDAGFGPRTTAKRLAQAGMTLTELDAVCLTHLDTDHFRKTWVTVLLDLGIPLHLHHWHLSDLKRVQGGQRLIDAGIVRVFDDGGFVLADHPEDAGVNVAVTRLQHDRQGTIGYRFDPIESGIGSLGYATDLGHAPQRLLQMLAGVDILCIESNYDEHMTINSSRPSWVNRRNMSDSGHLSNDQSFAAVREIDALSPTGLPKHVVLLHRSSQCNHAMKVLRVYEKSPSISSRLTLTEQRTRTRWLHADPLSETTRSQMHFNQDKK